MARLLDPDSDLRAQLEVLTSEGVATSAIEGKRWRRAEYRGTLRAVGGGRSARYEL